MLYCWTAIIVLNLLIIPVLFLKTLNRQELGISGPVFVYSHPAVSYLFVCIVLGLMTTAIIKGWFNIRKLYGLLIIWIPSVVLITALFILYFSAYSSHTSGLSELMPKNMGHRFPVILNIISKAQFFGENLELSNYVSFSGSSESFVKYINLGFNAADRDYLLTFLIIRFGFIAVLAISAVFLAFHLRVSSLCRKQKNGLSILVSNAALLVIEIQITCFLFFNLGLQNLYIFLLPLFSNNFTTLVFNMALIGIILSVFKSGDLVRDNTPACLNRQRLEKVSVHHR